MKKNTKIIIGILLTFLIILTTLVIQKKTSSWDNSIYQSMMYFKTPTLDAIMKTITSLGNTIPVLCVTCIIMVYLTKKERYLFACSIITTVLSNQIIKRIVRIPRPDHLRLVKESGFSYPSGHAMIAIGLYGLLLYLINKKVRDKRKRIIGNILLAIIIIGIGISRVYVGVHNPSDIIGGYLLSTIILICNITYWTNRRGVIR